MAEISKLRKVKTPPFRMSFPSIPPHEAREDDKSKRRSYQLGMLFPPGLVLEPFKVALWHAMADRFGPDDKKWPRIKRKPEKVIKNFEEYNAEAKTVLKGDWKGWTLIRANRGEKTKDGRDNAPHVVGPTAGADGKFPVITDRREVYGGRWARATIDAYYYPDDVNDGVTFGLGNVQLLKHDTAFGGGRPSAEDDFDNASEAWSGQGDAFEKGEPAAAAAGDWS